MAEEKPDPRTHRVMAEVPSIPRDYMPHDEVFNERGLPRWRALRDWFKREGRVSKEDLLRICDNVSVVLRREPNMLPISFPITVCGDIHGQFFDLVQLLEVGGDPEDTQYLFLGDYVDRGVFSIEVVLLLFSIKLNYPDRFWLLRGNHECRQLTSFFNFQDECRSKYDLEVWDAFMAAFDCLPLTALIEKKYLCMHGGISPEMRSLKDIRTLDRFSEPPTSGLMCDILWADPCVDALDDVDEEDLGILAKMTPKEVDAIEFLPNEKRGCSYLYGYRGVCQFLDNNGLLSIIRAHEAQLDGYRLHREHSGFPSVITVFSAPNYCDVYNNRGAVLELNLDEVHVKQFECVPHPYYLPNFMDVFTWSLPFVAEKATEMLLEVAQAGMEGLPAPAPVPDEDAKREEAMEAVMKMAAATTRPGATKAEVLRSKIRAIGKWSRIFRVLREEAELVLEVKNLIPNKRLPPGALSSGADSLREAQKSFRAARSADRISERRPSVEMAAAIRATGPGAAAASPFPAAAPPLGSSSKK
eukprot:PLAT11870.1.p1 GENE.PLAT11870.1~~PLAT11870.1.p1  ORF type:complete len:528 (+),score=256.63 PLAT11870.1:63-1646(+)